MDADAVAGGGDAVNGKLELGLADEVVIVEVGDAADPAQDIADLARLRLQHEQVGPIQLNRELPLDAGERLVDIVLDRLREVRRDAGDRRQAGRHLRDELVLVPDPPLVPRREPDVELGVVGAVRVGAVVGRAKLRDDHAHLWKHEQALADVVDVRPGALERDADRELDAEPEVPFVELGQKLLAEESERE